MTVKEAVSFCFFLSSTEGKKKRIFNSGHSPCPVFILFRNKEFEMLYEEWIYHDLIIELSPHLYCSCVSRSLRIRKNPSCIQEVGIILFIRKVYFSMKPGKLLRFEKNTISSLLFPENLSVVSTLTTFKFKKCPSPSLPQPLSHHSLSMPPFILSPFFLYRKECSVSLFSI